MTVRYTTQVGAVIFHERLVPAQLDKDDPLLFMETLVTQALYQEVTGLSPSYFQGPQRPVEQVSWFDGIAFANALSERLGLNPCYVLEGDEAHFNPFNNGFRYALRAEWDWAAGWRNGNRYAGSNVLSEVGHHTYNQTQDVAQLKPNAFGLFDMNGNVNEWAADNHKYVGEHSPRARCRFYLGGSYRNLPFLFTARRNQGIQQRPHFTSSEIGLRLCRSTP